MKGSYSTVWKDVCGVQLAAGFKPDPRMVEASTEGGAAEQRGNILQGVPDFHLKNGSSQGHNLALTDLYVPSSLDSGTRKV